MRSQYVLDALRVCVCVWKRQQHHVMLKLLWLLKRRLNYTRQPYFTTTNNNKMVRTQKATIDGCMGNDTRNWASSTLYSIICREKKTQPKDAARTRVPRAAIFYRACFFLCRFHAQIAGQSSTAIDSITVPFAHIHLIEWKIGAHK